MKLAKPCIDVGVQTNRKDAMLRFWQTQVGLPFEELLPVGGGTRQHRHAMNGSVFKLNHARDPLPGNPPSGYTCLWIAREGLEAPRELVDPDDSRIVLVPPGHRDVRGIGLSLGVRSPAAFRDFYTRALGLEEVAPDVYRCGDSLLLVEADEAAPDHASMSGTGYRYFTIQVHEVDAVHAAVLAGGGREGMAPRTLGDVARISFVRDPDGNWIELSQRASLTGPLPG